MKTIVGSQVREPIEETEYEFEQWQDFGKAALLKNKRTGIYEQYVQNDDFAGYVIVINGKGFEFVGEVS